METEAIVGYKDTNKHRHRFTNTEGNTFSEYTNITRLPTSFKWIIAQTLQYFNLYYLK